MLAPPLNDFVALIGIDLVLVSAAVALLDLSEKQMHKRSARWTVAVCLVLLWIPAGPGNLPLVGYVRGVVSDPSVTLVAMSGLLLCQRLYGCSVISRQERAMLSGVIFGASALLYPTALGWGDWDAYRAGWGTPGMWTGLVLVGGIFWAWGFRLLAALLGIAMLAWAVGLLESANLWDYLIDPWLAVAAFGHCVLGVARTIRQRARHLA